MQTFIWLLLLLLTCPLRALLALHMYQHALPPQLAKLVTRDSMIGVAPALTPAQLQEMERRRQQAAA
jgi:hypothetical protein